MTLLIRLLFKREIRSFWLLIGFVLLSFDHVNGQFEDNYRPIAITDTLPADLGLVFKNRLNLDLISIQEKGKIGSYLKTLHEKRSEAITKTVNSGFFILDQEITAYLSNILETIYEANPDLPRETSVFPFRSDVPNAVSFGEGTLCLMLGLLSRLESEDEIAFVLCHELAHYHRSHSRNQMQKIAALNYDKDLKKKIDGIMNSPYDRYARLKQVYRALDLDFMKHGRDHETEADSVGLIYYLNTKYHRHAPLTTMRVLAIADSTLYPDPIRFRNHFDFAVFPFKASWDKYVKSSTWHAPSIANDSVGTHPACDVRFAALQRQLKLNDIDPSSLLRGSKPNVWRIASQFESVHSNYYFKQYGKSLFIALQLAEKYPTNTWLHAMIARNLYRIHEAQKQHRLGFALELPDPRFDESYDRFLTFMHKLRLSEVEQLAYNYVTTRPERDFYDEEFLYSLWLCSSFPLSKLDPDEVRKDYAMRFPSGKYLNEMKKLN